ncbi:MAG: hypothetical protein OXE95_11825 [Chloroflexi bacterium]|nr:hypothetical protein [Chloroflexota bacterium]MCY4248248.1 hypothetical protein [Chloroflexota bacterium]
MKKIALLFVFASLFILLAGPALAQSNVMRVKVRKGEPFTVKLKKNSTYIVNPFPNILMPEAEVASGGGCIVNASPYDDYFMQHSIFQTNSRNCKVTLNVVWDEVGSSGVVTFIRVKNIKNIDLTADWQPVTLGKGTFAVWGEGPLMVAEIAGQSAGCREAHSGRNNRLGIADIVHSHIDEDNTAIDGATQEQRPGINSWHTWFRVLPKRCELQMRSILNGDGQAGRLTLLKLSSQPIRPRG